MHPDPNLKEKYNSLITYKNGKVLNTIDGKIYTYLGEQEENEKQNEYTKVDSTDIYKGCENISVSGTCELSFEDSNIFTLLNDAIEAFTDADFYITDTNNYKYKADLYWPVMNIKRKKKGKRYVINKFDPADYTYIKAERVNYE